MELLAMLLLTATAWIHARLTVVNVIHRTQTPEQMLRGMCTGTYLFVIAVTVCYFTMGAWGNWIVLFALARSLFLLGTNWSAVCDNYYEIKRLLAGN